MKKLACFLFLFSSVCFAGSQNLWQIFQLAQQNAANNQSNKLVRDATVNTYRSLASGLFPQLSASDDYASGPYGSGSTRGFYHSHLYDIQATQQIFNPILFASVASEYHTAQSAVATYQYQHQQFIQSIIKSYFAILESQDLLHVAQAKEVYLQTLFNQAKAQFKVGVSTVTSAMQAQSSYLEAHAERIAAENAVHNAILTLQTYTNARVSKLAPLLNENIQLPPDFRVSHWVSLALVHNENLKSAHFDTESARDNLDNRESEWLPSIDVIGQISKSDNHSTAPGSPLANIGHTLVRSVQLNVSWNIFTGPDELDLNGANISSVNEGANLYASSQLRERQLRRDLHSSIYQDIANVKTDVVRIKQYNAAVRAGDAATKQFAAKFKVGASTMADYLKQVSQLYQDRSNLLQARYQFINDKVQLYLDAGVLSPTQIHFLNNQL